MYKNKKKNYRRNWSIGDRCRIRPKLYSPKEVGYGDLNRTVRLNKREVLYLMGFHHVGHDNLRNPIVEPLWRLLPIPEPKSGHQEGRQ